MKLSSIGSIVLVSCALAGCSSSDAGGGSADDAGSDTTPSGDSSSATDSRVDAAGDAKVDGAADSSTDAHTDAASDAPVDAEADAATDAHDAACSDDLDHDGYVSVACGGTDCNDANPAIHPGATETCNGLDDNCNGAVDEGLPTSDWYPDCDGDGYGSSGATPKVDCRAPDAPPTCVPGMPALWSSNDLDCQDFYATVHPGAAEVCDGFDTNCDGTKETDADADGHYALGTCPTADDCDDDDRTVHPGADYSSVGICPKGSVACLTAEASASDVHVLCWSGSTCPASPSCDPTAPGACPPPATWDYDCDGAVVMEPSGDGSCSGIFTCHPSGGVLYTTPPAPECGATPVSLYVCVDSGSGCHFVGVGGSRLPCK